MRPHEDAPEPGNVPHSIKKTPPLGRLTNTFLTMMTTTFVHCAGTERLSVCCLSLTETTEKALRCFSDRLQPPAEPTFGPPLHLDVLAQPLPPDTRSVFPKPSSDLDTCLSKPSKAPRGQQNKAQLPRTSSKHDGQPAVPQCFSSARGMQPREPLPTPSPRSLSLGPPHHLGLHRGHHSHEAFLYPFPNHRRSS